ncbi:LuxR family transcriptional regulator [Zavarzinia sp.]|uniref:helix-turn-helix transcriptional regulator n=1 Tax=Zavarzinia sp. TaxID=2027920 RepID=UPI00356414D2
MNDDLLDLIARVDGTQSATAAFEIAAAVARRYGYESGACMEIPRVNQLPADALMILRMPQPWVDHYVASNFAVVDPVFRRAATELLPFTWAEASQGVKPSARRVMNEATDFGLRHGLTVPLHGPGGYRAELTFAGTEVDGDPRVRRLISHLSLAVLGRAHQLVRAAQTPDLPTLTQRERECLQWVSAGKSDWAISQIIGLSEATVHYYIENAKKKYGTASRTVALMMAIKMGEVAP